MYLMDLISNLASEEEVEEELSVSSLVSQLRKEQAEAVVALLYGAWLN